MIDNIILDTANEIQFDHFKWYKKGEDFLEYNWDKYEFKAIYEKTIDIIANLPNIPKTYWNLIDLLDNKYDLPNEIFERREPIFVSHNSHNFLRNRKMNLRRIIDIFILNKLPIDFKRSKINLFEIEEFVSIKNNCVMVFDIFSFYENLTGLMIVDELEQTKTCSFDKNNPFQKFSKEILENTKSMFMDNLIDHSLASEYLKSIFKDLILEIYGNIPFKIDFATDEIIIYWENDKKTFTGKELYLTEKYIEKTLINKSSGKLHLNKSKTKLINSENIVYFKNCTLESYNFSKTRLKNLELLVEENDIKTLITDIEELFLKKDFKLINRFFINFSSFYLQREKLIDIIKEQKIYENVFKGVVYDDLQLFFERKILKIK